MENCIAKKFLSCFLAFVYCIFCFPNFSFAESGHESHKRTAIIIVPGILSTGLFYEGKKTLKYSHNEPLWLAVGGNKLKSIKAGIKFLFFHKDLACDENGDPCNSDIGIPSDQPFSCSQYSDLAKYGVLSTYKKLIDSLEENFGENTAYNCSIILHNYDWRVDPRKSAKLLTSKVMEYDQVILIGYSLGGLVSSACARELLNKGEIGRIKTFISVAVPYNGSVRAFHVMKSGLQVPALGDSKLPVKTLNKLLKIFGISKIVKSISHNCESMYALLPNESFFHRCPEGFIEDSHGGKFDFKGTLNYIRNEPWYKKKDGGNKKHLENACSFHDYIHIHDQHIINYINSKMFIVGTGLQTPIRLRLLDNEADILKYADGDGTVPKDASAVPPLRRNDGSSVHEVSASHSRIFDSDVTLDLISKHISKTLVELNENDASNSTENLTENHLPKTPCQADSLEQAS